MVFSFLALTACTSPPLVTGSTDTADTAAPLSCEGKVTVSEPAELQQLAACVIFVGEISITDNDALVFAELFERIANPADIVGIFISENAQLSEVVFHKQTPALDT